MAPGSLGPELIGFYPDFSRFDQFKSSSLSSSHHAHRDYGERESKDDLSVAQGKLEMHALYCAGGLF